MPAGHRLPERRGKGHSTEPSPCRKARVGVVLFASGSQALAEPRAVLLSLLAVLLSLSAALTSR